MPQASNRGLITTRGSPGIARTRNQRPAAKPITCTSVTYQWPHRHPLFDNLVTSNSANRPSAYRLPADRRQPLDSLSRLLMHTRETPAHSRSSSPLSPLLYPPFPFPSSHS